MIGWDSGVVLRAWYTVAVDMLFWPKVLVGMGISWGMPAPILES